MLKTNKSDLVYVLILIISLILFISIIFFLKVDIVVHGRGYLQIKDKNILIEHPDGGRIKKLLIREGELVNKGELLAIIDNSYIAEEVAKTNQQKESLLIRIKRLDAEIKNLPFDIPLNVSNTDKSYYEQEFEIYNSEMKNFNNELITSESIEKQKKTELNANIIKVNGLEKDLKYAEQQIKLVSNLVAIKAAAKGTLLTKEAEYQKIKNDLEYSKSMTNVLQSSLDTAILDTGKIRSKFIREKSEELLKHQEQLGEIQARLVGVNAREIQSNVYSPVQGRIQKMFKSHVGSVLPAGGALFEITPDNVPVIAVVKLNTKDRDKVWAGMKAKIDIGGTGRTKSKPISGNVELVSADSFTDERGGRYYQADILLENSKELKYYPGMAVDAYILTGERSIAEYILSPLLNGAKRSFSEQ
ncbi:HlyD family type I secretion periplasmic adaptor subunit [Salmonella enterica]|nr:HlyD family type I secretion periplasmic adaptor subunit [Salmonella enterica]EAX3609108.1 HlyD family type I secretion periplasmic adaptor subunit [Salmonella enterica]EGW6282680.1 HlyD family type I secretion periplasmic adaptor subunit [Salmonella enterica]EGX3935069.1 HlyD family type I secretion periplasmic adaptor subunit [Salmonella enterica]